jgi:hypothetical protein
VPFTGSDGEAAGAKNNAPPRIKYATSSNRRFPGDSLSMALLRMTKQIRRHSRRRQHPTDECVDVHMWPPSNCRWINSL